VVAVKMADEYAHCSLSLSLDTKTPNSIIFNNDLQALTINRKESESQKGHTPHIH